MANIYLTGMMGSGKTVTGKSLAEKLHYDFVDLDQLIQERNHKSIVEIFASEGETFFRDQEALILKEISSEKNKVVATGGGTILRPENIETMKKTGKVIYLETGLEMLWSRVKDKKDRPLLKGEDPKENLTRIYRSRLPIYAGSCHANVHTDGKTGAAVADEIVELLKRMRLV